jgi:PAS domain S-box-containing protein
MRNNQPVTGTEYILRDDQSPISRTDLQGNITFANADFIEASGYTEDELLGQPHNIVRHPDMPVEAFADLWKYLNAGRSWTGMVKNRRKNGDHYWVLANASPMWERGQVVGFASVRMKPPREAIAPTDAIYRRFREGKASGLRVERGHVVRTGVLGWFDQLIHPGIRGRLVYLLLLASLLIVAIGWLGLSGMGKTNHQVESLYREGAGAVLHLDTIARLQLRNHMALPAAISLSNPSDTQRLVAEVEKNSDTISKTWDSYLAIGHEPDEKKFRMNLRSFAHAISARDSNPRCKPCAVTTWLRLRHSTKAKPSHSSHSYRATWTPNWPSRGSMPNRPWKSRLLPTPRPAQKAFWAF